MKIFSSAYYLFTLGLTSKSQLSCKIKLSDISFIQLNFCLIPSFYPGLSSLYSGVFALDNTFIDPLITIKAYNVNMRLGSTLEAKKGGRRDAYFLFFL